MTQKEIRIRDVDIPIIIDEIEYYPFNFIITKILGHNSIKINKFNNYKLKEYDVKFKYSVAKTSCINRTNLKSYIRNNLNIANMKTEYYNNYNALCEYLKIDNRLYYEDNKPIVTYSDYELDCISQHRDVDLKFCVFCGKEFPNNTTFFVDGMIKCKQCYKHYGRFSNKIKNRNNYNIKYGNYKYVEYINNENVINSIYEKYNDVSYHLFQKEHILEYIKESVDKNLCTIDDFYEKLNVPKRIITKSDVLIYIFGLDYIKYNLFLFKCASFNIEYTDEARFIVFSNYLNYKNINIDDIKYMDSTYIRTILFSTRTYEKNDTIDVLSFMFEYCKLNSIEFYPYKTYANTHFYNVKQNRIETLILFINNELKIDDFKIPLYLTPYSIKRASNTLYRVLSKHYNGNLYTWVNECYPNMFDELDFNINYKRMKFDSMDEAMIDDYLRNEIGFGSNLIYNDNNEIVLFGKRPDWILLKDDKVIIIEYAGMYVASTKGKSKTNTRYIEHFDNKMEIYEKQNELYELLVIYPEDMDNNMNGVKTRVASIT